MTKKVETTVVASSEVPVKDTKTLLAEAIAAGNFKEVSRLALVAANEEKLAKLAYAEAVKAAAKEAEKAEVAAKVAELTDQLMNGEFETFAGLWTIIRTTLPAATKNAKVPSGTNSRTATNGRKTKLQLTDDLLAAGPCTLVELTAVFAAEYPEDMEAENHARQYLAKYARKDGDFYIAK
jgi:hypothetical protein